jgi:hypothetical protein
MVTALPAERIMPGQSIRSRVKKEKVFLCLQTEKSNCSLQTATGQPEDAGEEPK